MTRCESPTCCYPSCKCEVPFERGVDQPRVPALALAELIEQGRLSLRVGVGRGGQIERDLTDEEEETICLALRAVKGDKP